MTSAQYITLVTLADVLGLPPGSSDTDCLDKIHELVEDAGGERTDDNGEMTLIRRGEHERVKLNPDGTATVTMARPFKFGAETISELTLREPEAGDFIKSGVGDKKGFGVSLALIASASGRQLPELKAMKARDIKTVSAVIGFLSDAGQ